MENLESHTSMDLFHISEPVPLYSAILPETVDHPRNLARESLTLPPSFMSTVREMRKRLILHTQQNSENSRECTLSHEKLPLRKWRCENKSIYGNKVALRNYEMVAKLSSNSYDLVLDIERLFLSGQLPETTNAKTITQHFFKFLIGKTSEESYRLLKLIRDGEETTTELNYVPSGKKNSNGETSDLHTETEQALNSASEELRQQKEAYDALNNKYCQLKTNYEELNVTVKIMKKSTLKLETTIALQKKKMEEVVEERKDKYSFIENVLADENRFQRETNMELEQLRTENSQLRKQIGEYTKEKITNDIITVHEEKITEENRGLKQQRETDALCSNIEFNDSDFQDQKKTGLLRQENDKESIYCFPLTTIYDKGMTKSNSTTKSSCKKPISQPVKKEKGEKIDNTDNEIQQTNKRKIKDENKLTIKELSWVAVAYEKHFFIGQVRKILTTSQKLNVNFLERVVGIYRWPRTEDSGDVEEKFVFAVVKMEPEGKHFALKTSFEDLNKKYSAYQNEYFKKRKINAAEEDMVVITEARQKKIGPFWPVDKDWQSRKCMDLGLEFIKPLPPIKKRKMKRTSYPSTQLNVLADGNCFFRTISIWITGCSEQHEKIRSIIVLFMKNKWQENGRKVVGEDVTEYLEKAKMNEPCVWATETELFAAAELLQTSILVFLKVGNEDRWVSHNPRSAWSGGTSRKLYLINLHQHFQPVIDIVAE